MYQNKYQKMAKKEEKKRRKPHRNGTISSTLIKISIFLIIILLSIELYNPDLKNLTRRSISPNLPEKLNGPWKENNILSKAEKLFDGKLHGPESIAKYNDSFYTGTLDGQIVKITGNKLETVTRLGQGDCNLPFGSKNCGHPLGVRITSSGDLYTVDCLNGLVKVPLNSKNPKPELIFNITTPVEQNASKFIDDLVIDETPDQGNIIYMTDSSRLWAFKDIVIMVLDMDDSGRVIKYDESTGKASVVMENLAFPNGIELTDDKSALLVAEFTHRKIHKHYLKGPKAGSSEVIIELPGEPDNIRRSSRRDAETYWVAINSPRTVNNATTRDWFKDQPIFRNLLIRVSQVIGETVSFIGKIVGSPNVKYTGDVIRGLFFLHESSSSSMIVEINSNGKIYQCLSSFDGSIHSLSEVRDTLEENGSRTLQLASYANEYIGKLVIEE